MVVSEPPDSDHQDRSGSPNQHFSYWTMQGGSLRSCQIGAQKLVGLIHELQGIRTSALSLRATKASNKNKNALNILSEEHFHIF